MAVNPESLKRSPYFAGLSRAEVEAIGRHFFEKVLTREEIIILEGEPASALYFVVSGAVKLLKTSAGGKEQILDIALPGATFNDAIMFTGGTNRYSAQAMGPAVVYGLPGDKLEAILRDYPVVARNLIGVLAGQLLRLTSLVEDLSFRTVTGRVARILLDYAADGGTGGRFLTQREMAAMAGTVREVVGRSLRDLADRGVITIDHHRIAIRDRKALENIAGTADET
ncbi:MAG: Crp/Fnr family transcriptional regulator [Dehalococcoidia bacterium]|jgi:CRP/FNR family transcriptional regulator|nr:MAG: Crp/Fnr family transcriptional regulator [Dehalococcoidia bacterium]